MACSFPKTAPVSVPLHEEVDMPQLSLYLDDETMDALRHNAAKEGLSLSYYTRRDLQPPHPSML
jgi:hypothetical protein